MLWERRALARYKKNDKKKRMTAWHKYRLVWIVLLAMIAVGMGGATLAYVFPAPVKTAAGKNAVPSVYRSVYVNESPMAFSVPEPSTLMLLGIAVPFLFRRPRRA